MISINSNIKNILHNFAQLHGNYIMSLFFEKSDYDSKERYVQEVRKIFVDLYFEFGNYIDDKYVDYDIRLNWNKNDIEAEIVNDEVLEKYSLEKYLDQFFLHRYKEFKDDILCEYDYLLHEEFEMFEEILNEVKRLVNMVTDNKNIGHLLDDENFGNELFEHFKIYSNSYAEFYKEKGVSKRTAYKTKYYDGIEKYNEILKVNIPVIWNYNNAEIEIDSDSVCQVANRPENLKLLKDEVFPLIMTSRFLKTQIGDLEVLDNTFWAAGYIKAVEVLLCEALKANGIVEINYKGKIKKIEECEVGTINVEVIKKQLMNNDESYELKELSCEIDEWRRVYRNGYFHKHLLSINDFDSKGKNKCEQIEAGTLYLIYRILGILLK